MAEAKTAAFLDVEAKTESMECLWNGSGGVDGERGKSGSKGQVEGQSSSSVLSPYLEQRKRGEQEPLILARMRNARVPAALIDEFVKMGWKI